MGLFNRSVGFEMISQADAKKIMDERTDYLLLDVRRPEEYAEGYIPGAVLCPNELIGNTLPAVVKDPNQLILIYCRSGIRSKQAAKKLAKAGCTQIKEFGGITTWPYGITR